MIQRKENADHHGRNVTNASTSLPGKFIKKRAKRNISLRSHHQELMEHKFLGNRGGNVAPFKVQFVRKAQPAVTSYPPMTSYVILTKNTECRETTKTKQNKT